MVIAVVGVLVGLLLPAVQSMRESARLSTCQNNLRQQGLACLSFESTFKKLPSAGLGARWMGLPASLQHPVQPAGWTYSVASHLGFPEIQAIVGSELTQPGVNALAQTVPAVFLCPSRPATANITNTEVKYYSRFSISESARLDYAANAGANYRLTVLGPESLTEADEFFEELEANADSPPDGVFWYALPRKLADIRDGMSNTFMLGEKWRGLNGARYGQDQPPWVGGSLDNLRFGDQSPVPDRVDDSSWKRFGSSHPAGLNFALCDGSVSMVTWSIDERVYSSFCNRRDSETLDEGVFR